MTKVGIIRCEKNAERCPLTSGLKNLRETTEGFSSYSSAELVGVFTCRCPEDNAANFGKILNPIRTISERGRLHPAGVRRADFFM